MAPQDVAQRRPLYALTRHVFVCARDDDIVLMDLRRDKYLALEADQTTGLASLVAGWPVVQQPSERAAESDDEARVLAEDLLKRDLLTQDPRAGKAATPVDVTAPVAELTADETQERIRIGAGELLTFLVALGTSKVLLRRWPLERVIERVRRRSARAGMSVQAPHASDLPRLVAVFDQLRSLLLSTQDACLFESLLLLEFLSRYRIVPTWVFGVHTRPFSAHCWVQSDGLVLNDTLDRVTCYTPILAV